MKKSRFEELICSLSDNEFKSLNFFVNSRVFTTNKRLPYFYKIISQSKNRSQVNVNVLKNELKKSSNISDANYRMLLTEFSNLIEKFIIIIRAQSEELTGLMQLLKYAFENNLEILCRNTIEKLEAIFKSRKDFSLNELFLQLEYLNLGYLFSGDKNYLKKSNEVLSNIELNSKLELAFNNGVKKEDLKDKRLSDNSNSFLQYNKLLYDAKVYGVDITSGVEKIFKSTDSKFLKIMTSDYLIYSIPDSLKKCYTYAEWLWENSNKRYKIVNAERILEIALEYNLALAKNIVGFLNDNDAASKNYFSKCMYYFYINDFKGCLFELNKLNPSDHFEKVKVRQLRMLCYIRLKQYINFQKSYDSFRKYIVGIKNKKEILHIVNFLQLLNNIISNKQSKEKLSVIKNKLVEITIDNKDWLENELSYFLSKSS